MAKGVKVLTVFCFSTENWARSKNEVFYLMRLFEVSLNKKNVDYYHKKGIRIKIVGQRERLPKNLQNKIKAAEQLTKNNTGGILNLAISYGGRADITQALKEIINDGVGAEKITEDLINQYLWTNDLPCPDLIIRTGGEQRLSNFLTWQSAYSELYFTEKYWPEFLEKDLDAAFENYSSRERRFGA